MLTTRERMEMHRANPTCNSCHRFMDPIGLALDNFDVTAKWRIRENGMPLDTRGDFYDGTPISTPAELATALLKRPDAARAHFTENLMAYALGRRVEYYDQPTSAQIARGRRGERLQDVVVHPGRREERRVPMQQADVEPTATHDDRGGRPAPNPSRGDRDDVLHHRKAHPRRTFLRGMGATVALPFLDAMVPAGRVWARRRAERHGRAWSASRGARRSPAATLGRQQHLCARAGRPNFDLSPTTRSTARAVPRLPDDRQQHRRADGRGVRCPEIGGDHFRSSAVFLTQSHPKQTQGSDIYVGHVARPDLRAAFGRTRRSRRCSSASRTSTRPAAAPTTTRASTPTRSAGRRRTSRCR
jgi:hypothetical protein